MLHHHTLHSLVALSLGMNVAQGYLKCNLLIEQPREIQNAARLRHNNLVAIILKGITQTHLDKGLTLYRLAHRLQASVTEHLYLALKLQTQLIVT